jgi:hypothetical protein
MNGAVSAIIRTFILKKIMFWVGFLSLVAVMALLYVQSRGPDSSTANAEKNQKILSVDSSVNDQHAMQTEFPRSGIALSTNLLPLDALNPGLRLAFEREDDLYALMLSHAKSSHPEGLWLVAKIAEYCADFGMNPSAYDASTDRLASHLNLDVKHYKSAREHVKYRCRGFASGNMRTAVGPTSDLVHKTRAAKAGSLAAETALLPRRAPLLTDSRYLADLIGRGIKSKDTDVYAELAVAVTDPHLTELIHRQAGIKTVNSEFSSYAFLLAACRLGRNCTPQGAMMTQMCVMTYSCGPSMNYENWLVATVKSPADVAIIRKIAAHLTSIKKKK